MISSDTAVETLSVILQRGALIERLWKSPRDKRTLVEELDYSRSTVDRAVRELESLDLVTYEHGEYVLTSVGTQIAGCAMKLVTEIEMAQKLQPFLRYVPTDEFTLDLRLLEDATLTVGEVGDPYAMINEHVQRLKTMERGQFLLPYTGMHATETAHERIVDDEAHCELVVEPEVQDTFEENSNYSALMDEMAETGRLTVFAYDGNIPYGVGVVDGVVQLIADEDGEPRALVESESDAVREWARDVITEYKQQSVPLLLGGDVPVEDEAAVD